MTIGADQGADGWGYRRCAALFSQDGAFARWEEAAAGLMARSAISSADRARTRCSPAFVEAGRRGGYGGDRGLQRRAAGRVSARMS